MTSEVKPQFEVKASPGKLGWGTDVLFNGQPIRNVVSIDVSNTITIDDVTHSRITIDLAGEPIIVSQQGE